MPEWKETHNKYGTTLDYIEKDKYHLRLFSMYGDDGWTCYGFGIGTHTVKFTNFKGTAEEAKAIALLFL